MSERTKIAWCDSTVNPVQGCDKVSDGCKNCYITTTTPFRVSGMKHGDPRTFHPSAFKLAEKLNRKPWICDECGAETTWEESAGLTCCPKCAGELHRRRIFWQSLGDWLDQKWNIEWLAQMLATIRRCDQCTHILVSKRWENFFERMEQAMALFGNEEITGDFIYDWLHGGPPRNVVGLCSVENQEMADKRIPQFLSVPLACRGLSLEPLLGSVNLKMGRYSPGAVCNLHWIIVGGESGPNARPCNVNWIRWLVRQGESAAVPTFVKQLGSNKFRTLPVECPVCHCQSNQEPGEKCIRGCDAQMQEQILNHPKGGDPAEWPQDLRVQQWPEGF